MAELEKRRSLLDTAIRDLKVKLGMHVGPSKQRLYLAAVLYVCIAFYRGSLPQVMKQAETYYSSVRAVRVDGVDVVAGARGCLHTRARLWSSDATV